MKKTVFALGAIALSLLITSCDNGAETTTTTDSSTVTTESAMSAGEGTAASQNITVRLDPSVSYVNLKTGKPVKLRVDTVTHYIIDEETSEPVTYYINPSTNDTFDQRGRLVNRALIRSSTGDYTIDESRISVTTDDNTDASNDVITTDTAVEGASTTGESKTKLKDDKFKHKTDDTKLKVKEGKVKLKKDPDTQ